MSFWDAMRFPAYTWGFGIAMLAVWIPAVYARDFIDDKLASRQFNKELEKLLNEGK